MKRSEECEDGMCDASFYQSALAPTIRSESEGGGVSRRHIRTSAAATSYLVRRQHVERVHVLYSSLSSA